MNEHFFYNDKVAGGVIPDFWIFMNVDTELRLVVRQYCTGQIFDGICTQSYPETRLLSGEGRRKSNLIVIYYSLLKYQVRVIANVF